MDSIYLVTTQPKSEMENFFSLIDCCARNRYYFQTNGYIEDQMSPKLAISLTKTWKGDTIITGDSIRALPFDEKSIYDRNENYPVIVSGTEYFPICSFECSEAGFLLDFIVLYLQHHDDCYIANVHLQIMNLNLLELCQQERNQAWMYINQE